MCSKSVPLLKWLFATVSVVVGLLGAVISVGWEVLLSFFRSASFSCGMHIVNQDSCILAFDWNNYVTRFNLTDAVANSTAQELSSAPLSHSFTWASSINPSVGLGYVMGGKGTVYRTLYTFDIYSGKVIHSPSVGYITNATYHLAADLRADQNAQRLYGLWNLDKNDGRGSNAYLPVEVNVTSGEPLKYFVDKDWAPSSPGANCMSGCGVSSNCGWFALRNGEPLFISSYYCFDTRLHYIVEVNVDSGHVTTKSFDFSVDEFAVESTTGSVFITSSNSNAIFDVTNGASGLKSPVVSVPNASIVGSNLIPIKRGICLMRRQDTRFGRSHPQSTDFTCAKLSPEGKVNGVVVYSVPFLDERPQSTVSYVTKASPCW